MVKNSRKFRKTNGWSYYLHVDGVESNPKDDEQKNLACHACHTIVKNKDYVFGAPSFLGKTFYRAVCKRQKMKISLLREDMQASLLTSKNRQLRTFPK